jgi:uncharacterized membrane protein
MIIAWIFIYFVGVVWFRVITGGTGAALRAVTWPISVPYLVLSYLLTIFIDAFKGK